MTRKRDLSRLTGLLSVAAEAGQSHPTSSLAIDLLRPGPGQPRREFDDLKLNQLARSISEQGVLQPLLVRPAGDLYEIVAGERRWRAARMANLTEVPVVVRTLSDHQARQVALIENLQREDLNTVDEVDAKLELVALALQVTPAEARRRLMQMLREPDSQQHAAVAALFEALGETWSSFVKNKLRILNWPAPVLEAVRAGVPFTSGALIARSGTEHQTRLLKLARAGASREELKTELSRLKGQQAASEVSWSSQQITGLGKVLHSRKWSDGLPASERQQLSAWLEKARPS
ncbi:ParB/RepB/Spo0J family partition protein [Deinococcus cavernae]|uniref:ParB/RepB/Spo0J family partition protein n=1 Tax=Deinococcus cavernae TaxID=2320857 RepID=A0A418VGE5_9DEIO|nr:ParB/RepB/Spo0J family partition protein [Deinococcus cavernae]RJF75199.1 ParB/RepB/Spo0J family partition protein [Deinococcus cavernae]